MPKRVSKVWTLTYLTYRAKRRVHMFATAAEALEHVRLLSLLRFHLESSGFPKKKGRLKREVVH